MDRLVERPDSHQVRSQSARVPASATTANGGQQLAQVGRLRRIATSSRTLRAHLQPSALKDRLTVRGSRACRIEVVNTKDAASSAVAWDSVSATMARRCSRDAVIAIACSGIERRDHQAFGGTSTTCPPARAPVSPPRRHTFGTAYGPQRTTGTCCPNSGAKPGAQVQARARNGACAARPARAWRAA